jgi:hypothetical protein
MATKRLFYNYKPKDKLGGIIQFVKELPYKLEYFIDFRTSNLFHSLNENGLKQISEGFYHAFNELKRKWNPSLIYIRDTTFRLEEAGLTGANLKLKTDILNSLWRKLIAVSKGFINFKDNAVVKTLGKFLKFLNSFLGSLKMVFPFVERAKEFKDCIESSIDLIPGK